MSSNALPHYSTVLFTDVWNDVDKFKADYLASPFKDSLSTSSPDNVSLVFYLLYARYGNNPIANFDINQWKFKMFSVIFQFGPTWEKRLDIQSKLRALTEDDLIKGAKAIYNTAMNPSTSPSTAALEELEYINSQNTTNYKKSKMDAYNQLWSLLETDVTNEFLMKFRPCFKQFVAPEMPLLYVEIDDEDEEDE